MPTALELTPAQRQRYIEAARQRAASHQPTQVDPDVTRERAVLVEHARQAAAELKTRFGARRVILFGSLVHDAWFTPDSDVDMAVEGLASDTYWEAWRMVERFITTRPVDLVELEAARPSLKQSIEMDGIPL